MRDHESGRISRRSVVVAIASGSVGSVAGCLGGSADPSDEESTEETAEEPEFPTHPIDEPREPPERHRCDGPCGMAPSNFPEWNAQLAHDGGQGAFFDTPGCLLSYRHDPVFYDAPEDPIVNVWVRDFESKELIDALEAFFVLDYDKERLTEPMAHNPKPFADRSDAVAYVESYDDLGKENIVDIDGFGAEQAHRYRDYPIDRE